MPLLHKQAPGLTTAMITSSLTITPMAALSRPLAGVRNNTIIITLPGSTKGATENLNAILPVLFHAVELARGGVNAGEKTHEKMKSSESSAISSASQTVEKSQNKHHSHPHPHHHHHHHHHKHHSKHHKHVCSRRDDNDMISTATGPLSNDLHSSGKIYSQYDFYSY